MARIAGVNVPDRKHAVIALTSIYGVGQSRAAKICAAAGVESTARLQDLTETSGYPKFKSLRRN